MNNNDTVLPTHSGSLADTVTKMNSAAFGISPHFFAFGIRFFDAPCCAALVVIHVTLQHVTRALPAAPRVGNVLAIDARSTQLALEVYNLAWMGCVRAKSRARV